MKKIVFACIMLVAFLFTTVNAQALVSVRGYYRSNGTYVAPHYRTSPNNTVTDNFSYNGYGTTGMSYGEASNLESYLRGRKTVSKIKTPKMSKREKKVQKCKLAGSSESFCKFKYMPKKK